MKRILCITGPTASGKSSLAIELCERLNGQIVSCDSMQIYKTMDIGTAKPTQEEQSRAKHYMIDVCLPSENYSSSDYVHDAKECIESITTSGKLPIICGGTGMYLESLLYISDGEKVSPPANMALREKLAKNSAEENYEKLKEIDPDAALSTHPNNIKRVIRALEMYYETGITKTELDAKSIKKCYDFRIYCLYSSDREYLYDRINKRVDIMVKDGLVEEVRKLSLCENTTAGQAIGYKEIAKYLRGESTLDEAIEAVKKASRNYAKRQITWWKHNSDAVMLDICNKTKDELADFIIKDFSKL